MRHLITQVIINHRLVIIMYVCMYACKSSSSSAAILLQVRTSSPQVQVLIADSHEGNMFQAFACCRRARASRDHELWGQAEITGKSEDHERALKAMRAKFCAAWRKLAEIKRQLQQGPVPPGNPWARMARHRDFMKKFEFYSRTLKHVKDVKKDCAGLVF